MLLYGAGQRRRVQLVFVFSENCWNLLREEEKTKPDSFLFFLCLKCFHFSVAVTSELARHQKEMLFGVTSVPTFTFLYEVRDYHLSSCCFPQCCLFGLLAGAQPKVGSSFSRDSSLLAAG